MTGVFSANRSPRMLSRAAFACLLGAAVFAAGTPARAADDDMPIDRKVFRNLLEGLGLKRDGEEAINYQERSPLVIPPNHDLPPPEASNTARNVNPAWPKDPDEARHRAELRAEANRNISDEREIEQNPLLPDQMAPGKRQRTRAARDDGYVPPANGYDNPLPPSKLGVTGNIFGNLFGSKEDEVAKFTGEPSRAALTDPPPGYRTPSPDQPYGLSKTTVTPKAKNYLEEHGTLEGGGN